ncbi:MAG: hypothetical protein WBO77_00960 [Microgenomates group bacterium]
MKIYVTHSSNFDYQNELYQPLRKSELNKLHEITLPHEYTTDQFNSKEYMKECNLILAEVSYPSTGQGIELGWANLYKVPIVCIYKKEARLSGSLKVISNTFIEYNDSENMIQKLTDYLLAFQNRRQNPL